MRKSPKAYFVESWPSIHYSRVFSGMVKVEEGGDVNIVLHVKAKDNEYHNFNKGILSRDKKSTHIVKQVMSDDANLLPKCRAGYTILVMLRIFALISKQSLTLMTVTPAFIYPRIHLGYLPAFIRSWFLALSFSIMP